MNFKSRDQTAATDRWRHSPSQDPRSAARVAWGSFLDRIDRLAEQFGQPDHVQQRQGAGAVYHRSRSVWESGRAAPCAKEPNSDGQTASAAFESGSSACEAVMITSRFMPESYIPLGFAPSLS
jgi:hypothetical protein